MSEPPRINIEKPRYDQTTYVGRAKHFFIVTSPFNVMATSADLDEARRIITDYRQGKLTTVKEDDLWRAKYLYDSAFHPATGEKMNVIGRMSCQVPMNMLIIGGMLAGYKSTPATVFWQWFNQSFMALVNYTNRSGGGVNTNQLIAAYVGATGGALASSLGLNKLAAKAPPVVGRMVPFAAVALANCINVPMMRSHELKSGITVMNDKDEPLGESVPAARKAITQVVVSRIVMASPAMVLPPVIISVMEKRWPIFRRPVWNASLVTLLAGVCLVFATPMCCALFPQKASIKVAKLEPALRQKLIEKGYKDEDRVYYNKGL